LVDGKLVDLAEYARQSAESRGEVEEVERDGEPVTAWLVEGVFTVTTAHFADPSSASVHLVIDLDPLHQQWEVDMWREGWQHIGTLHGTDPAVLTFLNDLLCASFGRE
jgi:hypothetical protein